MSVVSAVLYTISHRIVGMIRLKERLAEALNDPLTDFVEMTEVRIASIFDPNWNEVAWPVATIPKERVLAATLDVEGHESSQTRIDKVTRKAGRQLGAVVGSLEVYGTGHLNFQGHPTSVLTTQLNSFFPVTDATILIGGYGNHRIETQVALVNREQVQAFTLLD